jgi:hypothetical protein
MRKSGVFFFLMAVNIVLLIIMGFHAVHRQKVMAASLQEKAALVKSLGLTDLCLFTEASYTRHLSQTDINTPFQDSPMALEHFPSGSLVTPPASIRKMNGKMD